MSGYSPLKVYQSARVTTQFDKTSNATLADVTGLSLNVAAGRTYKALPGAGQRLWW